MTLKYTVLAILGVVMAVAACSETFEAKGDTRLVGQWSCSQPSVILESATTEVEIDMEFHPDGSSQVDMIVKDRPVFGPPTELYMTMSNFYRVEGEQLIEKEIKTKINRVVSDGIEEPRHVADEIEKDFREDAGKIIPLGLRFVNKDKIVLDEATDNVICTRKASSITSAQPVYIDKINGSWRCERSLLTEGEIVSPPSGLDIHIDGTAWRTRTTVGDHIIDYQGHATYLSDVITTEFTDVKNSGDLDDAILERQSKQVLPTSVRYEISDLNRDGFRLKTSQTQLDCSALEENN